MVAASSSYHKVRYDLALMLMDAGAILTSASDHPLVVTRKKGLHGREKGFKLKLHEKNPDAPLSPIFLNFRTSDNPKPGPLTPKLIDIAARCMRSIEFEGRLQFDAVVGIPRAGEPFAKLLGKFSGKPCLTLNKCENGGKRKIASLRADVPPSVRKVLVVDDLITKADSKREAIEVLRSEGMVVTDIVVLVDREQGGRKGLLEAGCTLHSVFGITEMLDMLVGAGKMKSKLRKKIHTYLVREYVESQ